MKHDKIAGKFNKMVITQLQRSMTRSLFRLFLVSVRPRRGYNMSSNSELHMEWFPRDGYDIWIALLKKRK
jgi:hypothetical protein